MDAKETSFYTAVLIICTVLGIIITYFVISIIRQHRRSLKLYKQNIHMEITTLEKERTRMAADLHDEGLSVFDKDDSEDLRTGNEADVSRDERRALDQVDYLPTRDENNLQNARMDNVDFQNESLNERGFGEERSGRDLDIPGNTDDTGEEDEENKHYSLGSSDNDNITEGTP